MPRVIRESIFLKEVKLPEKYALIIDGGFLRNKLRRYISEDFITAQNIVDYCKKLQEHSLKNYELFRIYYYDCDPYVGKVTHPITGETKTYGDDKKTSKEKSVIDNLAKQDNFAIRKGRIKKTNRWKIHSPRKGRTIQLNAVQTKLSPVINQKQVDMKIGLDIAWLASKKIVDRIVLITSDSDFIPAIKFARKEGLIVYLNHLNQMIDNELRIHSDYVIDFPEKNTFPVSP